MSKVPHRQLCFNECQTGRYVTTNHIKVDIILDVTIFSYPSTVNVLLGLAKVGANHPLLFVVNIKQLIYYF